MSAKFLKVGTLVRKKFNGELGMLIEVQRSYEANPDVRRFKILWCRFGFEWDRLRGFEVVT